MSAEERALRALRKLVDFSEVTAIEHDDPALT